MGNEAASGSREPLARIVHAIRERERFVLSSHARPDGDSIGAQLALAHALKRLGKSADIVNRDAPPASLESLPGADSIEVAAEVTGAYDAAIVLECSSLDRTEVTGLERYFLVNIDHHTGNRMYGALNWYDPLRRRVRRDGPRPRRRPRRSPDSAHRHPALRRHPHRHRLVPAREHHAAHVRHLQPGSGERSRRCRRGGRHLPERHHGPAEADRRPRRRDAAGGRRSRRPAARRRRAAARHGLPARRHGRVDQPARCRRARCRRSS